MRKSKSLIIFCCWLLVLGAVRASCGEQTSRSDSDRSWTASPELVKAQSQRRPDILYDEERVPIYTLPDPLVMSDGTEVTDASTWRAKRRPEIL